MPNSVAQRDVILIVDDDRDELRMLVEALERAALTALVARSGHEALGLLERVTPDLILMDAVMSGLSGFETCRRIRRQPWFTLLPIIFLTGLKDTDHVLEGLTAGGVDYVAKPVIIDELLARIRIHISNARAASSARIALDATGRHLLATDAAGQPLWCTPQAASLISSHFGPFQDLVRDLPAPVVAVLKHAVTNQRRDVTLKVGEATQTMSFTLLAQINPNEYLFVLTETTGVSEEDRLAHEYGLTGREAEVLLWISRGKSSHDIAEILGISPRTVHKHLERIFAKLGVENRSSATALALQTMAKLI